VRGFWPGLVPTLIAFLVPAVALFVASFGGGAIGAIFSGQACPEGWTDIPSPDER
jgi:hypothetical protein